MLLLVYEFCCPVSDSRILFCRIHAITIYYPNMKPIIMITRKMVIVPAINTLLLFLNCTKFVSIIVTSMAVKVVNFNFICNTKIVL